MVLGRGLDNQPSLLRVQLVRPIGRGETAQDVQHVNITAWPSCSSSCQDQPVRAATAPVPSRVAAAALAAVGLLVMAGVGLEPADPSLVPALAPGLDVALAVSSFLVGALFRWLEGTGRRHALASLLLVLLFLWWGVWTGCPSAQSSPPPSPPPCSAAASAW